MEPAKRFTRLTTTCVRANKTTRVKAARKVSYFSLVLYLFSLLVYKILNIEAQHHIIKDGGMVVGFEKICTLKEQLLLSDMFIWAMFCSFGQPRIKHV